MTKSVSIACEQNKTLFVSHTNCLYERNKITYRHQPAAVSGGEKAEHGEDHGDERHAEELGAGADADGEGAGRGGRAENVAVYQLPPSLLRGFLHRLELVILRDVPS